MYTKRCTFSFLSPWRNSIRHAAEQSRHILPRMPPIISAAGGTYPRPDEVSKLEAAERLLAAAVRLFFENRDVLPTVSLTGAASQVIHDLLKNEGMRSLFRSGAVIKEQHRARFIRWFKDFENFLKHADHDPNATLEFDWTLAELMLHVVAFDFGMLTRRSTWPLTVFTGWAITNHPERFVENEYTRPTIEAARRFSHVIDKRLALALLDAEPHDFKERDSAAWERAIAALREQHASARPSTGHSAQT
jgi:hypothetical protein